MDDRAPAGFTLVELLFTIALLGVLLAAAIPATGQFIDRNRLRSAAEQIAADLRDARSEALKSTRASDVKVSFKQPAGAWCYGLTRGTTCNCAETDSQNPEACVIRAAHTTHLKTVHSADFPGIQLDDVRFAGAQHTAFDAIRGTARAGRIMIGSRNGYKLTVRVSPLGRIRICAPPDTPAMLGYPPC